MEGLDKFKDAFEAFADNYVIIGGTACEMTMSGTEVRPRATHDIDMIVIVERMTHEYGQRFWDFIHEGGYQPRKRKSDGTTPSHYELYRFVDSKPGYPQMIELLARHQDIFGDLANDIEPLPVDDIISSLSAIMMDDDYYLFTLTHRQTTNGISHADSAALIALKARAYLNLLNDKANGKHVDERDIKKHRSDVLKLVLTMPNDAIITAPQSIVTCIHDFVAAIRAEWETLATPLAQALGNNIPVDALLTQLDELFVVA